MAIAAAADDRHRRRGSRGSREDHPVALQQSGLREPKPAEPISFVGIGPGDVEHDICAGPVERLGKGRRKSPQILVVAGAILERDIKRAGIFPQWKVAGAMHRHGEHGRIGGEDLRRAIPLVDVAVEDQHPLNAPPGLHFPGRHGRVVEHAEALAPVGAGVVRATGETSGDAILEGGSRRIHGRARASQRPLDQFAAPGEPDPPHLVPRERARHHPAEIASRVHAEQFIVGSGMRLDEFERHPGGCVLLQPPSQEHVFVDRKAMAIRERQEISIAGKESHA